MKNSPGHIAFKSIAIISALTLGGGLVAYRQLSAEDAGNEPESPEKSAVTAKEPAGFKESPEAFANRFGGPLAGSATHLSSSKSAPMISFKPVDATRLAEVSAQWKTPAPNQTVLPSQRVSLAGSKAMIGVITPSGLKTSANSRKVQEEGGQLDESTGLHIFPAAPDTVIIFKTKSDDAADESLVFSVRLTGDSYQVLPINSKDAVARSKAEALMTPELVARIRSRLRSPDIMRNYEVVELPVSAAEPRQFTVRYQLPSSKRSGDIFHFEATGDGSIRLVGSDKSPATGYLEAIRAYIGGHPSPKSAPQPNESKK